MRYRVLVYAKDKATEVEYCLGVKTYEAVSKEDAAEQGLKELWDRTYSSDIFEPNVKVIELLFAGERKKSPSA